MRLCLEIVEHLCGIDHLLGHLDVTSGGEPLTK